MCNRYVSPEAGDIERQWHLGRSNPWRGAEVWPRREGAFLRSGVDGLECVVGRWGLVPSYHRKPLAEFKLSTNNARWEDKVHTSAAFKASWVAGRRCVIPATWFNEPYWGEDGLTHTPWKFARADGRLLGLAGLWNRWHAPDGQALETYTMITINADNHELMRRMHKPERDKVGNVLPPELQDKRMVVVLDDNVQDAWLRASPAEAEQLVQQWPAHRFSAGPLVTVSEGKPVSLDPTTGELF